MKNLVLMISCLLFFSSLFCKCFCTGDGCNSRGIFLLLFGWAGIFTRDAALAWYANPLLVASWITTSRSSKGALLLSILASLGCLSFLLFKTVIDNEGGVPRMITGYKIGYWLWVLSAVTLTAWNLNLIRLRNEFI